MLAEGTQSPFFDDPKEKSSHDNFFYFCKLIPITVVPSLFP
jgi:hypothetical protein